MTIYISIVNTKLSWAKLLVHILLPSISVDQILGQLLTSSFFWSCLFPTLGSLKIRFFSLMVMSCTVLMVMSLHFVWSLFCSHQSLQLLLRGLIIIVLTNCWPGSLVLRHRSREELRVNHPLMRWKADAIVIYTPLTILFLMEWSFYHVECCPL